MYPTLARILLALTVFAHLGFSAELPDKLAPHFRPPERFAKDLGGYRSPLLFRDGKAVTTPEQWSKRREEILTDWHGSMGPWPERIAKPKVVLLTSSKRDGLTQQHVEIEVAPGATRKAYLLLPEGKGPFPAMVVVYYDPETGIGVGKNASHRDFAYQLARRGFVTLSLGSAPESYYPDKERCKLQPLSFHAYVGSTCYDVLANRDDVDAKRIGVMGHSYGGKWAMFAACLDERFALGVWSDPGIAFDEKRSNVNYWDPWYLGFEPGKSRKRGLPSKDNPSIGPYRRMVEAGRDLHELQALMAPRPFLVSGGSEDHEDRWRVLNHVVAVNTLLGQTNRVAMTNRPGHSPTDESNDQLYAFVEHFLKAKTK